MRGESLDSCSAQIHPLGRTPQQLVSREVAESKSSLDSIIYDLVLGKCLRDKIFWFK